MLVIFNLITFNNGTPNAHNSFYFIVYCFFFSRNFLSLQLIGRFKGSMYVGLVSVGFVAAAFYLKHVSLIITLRLLLSEDTEFLSIFLKDYKITLSIDNSVQPMTVTYKYHTFFCSSMISDRNPLSLKPYTYLTPW